MSSLGDRDIALRAAMAYVAETYPQARQVWGDAGNPPEPDDLDGVWQAADLWIVVHARAGEYRESERAYPWGGRILPGSRSYLQFAAFRLREAGHETIAAGLEDAMYDGRVHYLSVVAVSDPAGRASASSWDISDETLAADVLAAAEARDSQAIDDLIQPLGPGAAKMIAAGYRKLDGWFAKSLVGRVARQTRDHSDPEITRLFEDLLYIPDRDPDFSGYTDAPREARTLALTWLEDEHDPARFAELYEDDEEQAMRVARHRATRKAD